jgi:hypothetical protein
MKKGCFIKGIFILTIVTGVIVYLVQTKFDTLVLKPGKSYLTKFARTAVDKRVRSIKDSPEKDSLNAMLKGFFSEKLFTMRTFSDKMFDPLTDSLDKFSKDSIIDKNELKNIKLILKKIEDEGSKEN